MLVAPQSQCGDSGRDRRSCRSKQPDRTRRTRPPKAAAGVDRASQGRAPLRRRVRRQVVRRETRRRDGHAVGMPGHLEASVGDRLEHPAITPSTFSPAGFTTSCRNRTRHRWAFAGPSVRRAARLLSSRASIMLLSLTRAGGTTLHASPQLPVHGAIGRRCGGRSSSPSAPRHASASATCASRSPMILSCARDRREYADTALILSGPFLESRLRAL